ncbi:amidohydrolase family protein [Shewanella waksmanii]|uniref:amidohydrolase family protein n=1 Tax=Shewanella waksmanii TaxID=213783 RepID=UPI00048D4EC5|nr:amidohydrolase family protein [Shewanella waksmanii]
MNKFVILIGIFFSAALAANDKLLIENITIVSSHLSAPNTNMNVLLNNGRIEQITSQKITDYDAKIDGVDKFLAPGLMDSHVHVSSVPGMGFGVEPLAVKHPQIVAAYYEQQPKSFLYYGVTQVLDPNPGLNSKHFTNAANHPDYFRCEVITSKDTFPYVEKTDSLSQSMYRYLVDEAAAANKPDSAESLVQQIASSGASCIKLYFEDGYGDANQWQLLSSATLKRIKVEADKHNLLIVAHANAFDMQQLALAAGVDVIAHGMWNWGQFRRHRDVPAEIAATLDVIIDEQVGYMPTQRVIAGLGEVMLPTTASSPQFLAVTPAPLLDWYQTPQAQWFKEELRIGFDGMADNAIAEIFLYGRIGKGNKVIQYLNHANHPILLASDFPGSPSYANQPGLTTFQEMKAMANAGLSPAQVLAAATINNAKQFKMDADYGTVQVGKKANLLVLERNPLASVEAWDSIETVILNGKPIARQVLVAGNEKSLN